MIYNGGLNIVLLRCNNFFQFSVNLYRLVGYVAYTQGNYLLQKQTNNQKKIVRYNNNFTFDYLAAGETPKTS